MIVKKQGGMTEFIPSPQEKRESLIRDHNLGLLANLHRRLKRLEQQAGLPPAESKKFIDLVQRMKKEELLILKLHQQLDSGKRQEGGAC